MTLVLGIDPGINGAAALIRVEAGIITQCRVGALLVEHAVGIFKAKNFMVLDQIDVIRLQSLQRFVQLFGRVLFCATVDLCHQEHSLAVAIA